MVYLLLEDVPASTYILWPGFERGIRAKINKDVDNEYLLRSWDAGKTIQLTRIGEYRTVKL